MEYISPNELKQLFDSNALLTHDAKHVFESARYAFRSLKNAPFFGEETLGIYIRIFDLLAANGYMEAAYELGLIYFNSEWWMPADHVKSFEYHSGAAESGHTGSMLELYIYYSKGIGTFVDNDKAFFWCKKAAELEHPRACYNMGTFYARGEGVEKNINSALQWYRKASDLGNGYASAVLGLMHKHGLDVPVNVRKGEVYFELSLEQGFDLKTFLATYGL